MKTAAWIAGLAALAGPSAARPAAPEQRPNIVLIFSDDLGIPALGCYGGQFKTPHLDALAASGVRFERCFSMPLCAPSRGVTISGRYPFRTGVLDNGCGAAISPQNTISVAATLRKAGYATAVAGKWRQLTCLSTREEGAAWGFDEFMVWGVDDEEDGKAAKGLRYWNVRYQHNGQSLDGGDRYGPDLLHEFVIDFIRRHRDGPFFVYYPTPLIHGPIQRTPDSPASGSDLYADNIAYLDKLVGKLLAELDALGLGEKTLVLFTGDNGSTSRAEQTVNNRPVDGRKGSLLEGGSRVPLIARWKGVTPPGKVLSDLVDFSDFYTTFAELAGAPLPEGVTLDGHSFAPQLRGQCGSPREWVFVQLGARWYVRGDRWKLDESGTLFDMTDAPFRQVATAPDAAGDAAAARAKLQAALDELKPAAGKVSAKRPKERKRKRRNAS